MSKMKYNIEQRTEKRYYKKSMYFWQVTMTLYNALKRGIKKEYVFLRSDDVEKYMPESYKSMYFSTTAHNKARMYDMKYSRTHRSALIATTRRRSWYMDSQNEVCSGLERQPHTIDLFYQKKQWILVQRLKPWSGLNACGCTQQMVWQRLRNNEKVTRKKQD